jgi:tRNA(adenine34) deaminase
MGRRGSSGIDEAQTGQRRASGALRWSAAVGTASTFPPAGLFAEDAATIVETMARPEVSPGGLGAAIRMVSFFINRAGRALPQARRVELERAKRALRARLAEETVVAPGERRAGSYRHVALGPVQVVRRGRLWVMARPGGEAAIPLGPDGWRHLEPL